jgi:hypothetical protein
MHSVCLHKTGVTEQAAAQGGGVGVAARLSRRGGAGVRGWPGPLRRCRGAGAGDGPDGGMRDGVKRGPDGGMAITPPLPSPPPPAAARRRPPSHAHH